MSDELTPQTPAPVAPVFETKKGMWSRGSGDTSGYGNIERRVAMPGQTAGPFGQPWDAVHARATELLPFLDGGLVLFDRGELTIFVPRERIQEAVRAFRDDAHLRFEICVSVSGVHYPQQTGAELHVVYHLLSITHNRRVRLEVTCPEGDAHVPSIVATYPMADWHERETWDMFGIEFDGHPGLTRILMPDDWVGHPQRKDYPLGGVDIQYKGATVPAPDQRRTYN